MPQKMLTPFMVPDHVVDHLGEQYGLADARPAEQAGLAAALQRRQHVDDLDAGFEYLGFCRAPRQRRRGLMYGAPFDIAGRRMTVDDVAEHVEHARQDRLADRCHQRPAGVFHDHAARQPFGGRQRDPAHPVRIELGQHLDRDMFLLARAQQRIDRRQVPIEADVHDTAAHRNDFTEIQSTGLIIQFCVPAEIVFRHEGFTRPPEKTSLKLFQAA